MLEELHPLIAARVLQMMGEPIEDLAPFNDEHREIVIKSLRVASDKRRPLTTPLTTL